MFMMAPPKTGTRFGDWPRAVRSIVGFWFFYALTVVVRAFLGTDPWTTLENKLVVVCIGVVLTCLIYLAIATFGDGGTIRRKATIAAIASAVASAILAGTLIVLEDVMHESR